MVVITEQDDPFSGILVDGFMPERERLESLYVEHFRPRFLEKVPKPKELHEDVLLFNIIEWNRKSIADLYVLGDDYKKIANPKFSHFSYEYDFEKNKDAYRIILLFERKHPEPIPYFEKTFENLEFTIKQPDQYKDYGRFKESSIRLLRESLGYFNAPCARCEENLVRIGFDPYSG